jgi:hyperosmotically inducible protein
MRYKIATTCFLIASVLAPVAAYAADGDSDRSRPRTFVKDSVITTKIKAKLAAEHPASAKHVRVDTDKNGVVWLSGTTDSQAEADKAVEIARGTEGVKSVNNKLTVKKDR